MKCLVVDVLKFIVKARVLLYHDASSVKQRFTVLYFRLLKEPMVFGNNRGMDPLKSDFYTLPLLFSFYFISVFFFSCIVKSSVQCRSEAKKKKFSLSQSYSKLGLRASDELLNRSGSNDGLSRNYDCFTCKSSYWLETT